MTAVGLLALALAACSGSTSLPIDAKCNPLGAGACMPPWPSAAFEIDDPATATGRRLAIPEDAIPRGASDEAVDPALWNSLDGFSPATPIIVEWPAGISEVGLAAEDNMDPSLALDSPTVILDLTSGERVAHWAEVGDDETTLTLHPAARLAYGHRYAVAITSRVMDLDGNELPISPGFRALLNDRRTDHPLLEAMRARVDDVFDALDEAGVVDDLVLAWDFTVASEASMQAELVAARERALATLTAHPSLFAITSETRDATGKQLAGTLDAPLVLSNGGEPRANTRLVRDDNGLPAIQGLYRIPFAAIVPRCADAKAPITLWGHAPFRDASDVLGESARAFAATTCSIVVGTDLRGRSAPDVPAVQRAIADLSNAGELDVIVQGVVDQAALLRVARTLFGERRFHYVGPNAAIAAMPELTRAAIVNPAEPRAQFAAEFAHAYEPIDAAIARALIDARWDRVQPARFAHPVLVQSAVGDTASWIARTYALPIVDPAVTPWGVKTLHAPHTGSAVVQDLRLQTLRGWLDVGQLAP